MPPSQSGNKVERICKLCGHKFTQYINGSPQKQCPTCTDILQRRPTVVVSREEVGFFPCVVIDSLPGVWSFSGPFIKNKDYGVYKIDHKGNSLDSEGGWQGRIVVRATKPYRRNALVSARCMKAIHIDRQTGKPREREYLVLDEPTDRPHHLPLLIYITLDLSMETVINKSMWSKSIFAGGTNEEGERKFRDEAMIAIIDKKHPIIISTQDSGNYVLPEDDHEQ